MEEKKIKRITIRLSLEDYLYLKKYYLWTIEVKRNRYKYFSEYIRDLLVIGLDEYY